MSVRTDVRNTFSTLKRDVGGGWGKSFTYSLPPPVVWQYDKRQDPEQVGTRVETRREIVNIEEQHNVALPQSAYGGTIPLLLGELEVAGNIIDIVPEPYKRKDGKWSVTFLVSFGTGLVAGSKRTLREVKADGKVIYSKIGRSYVYPGLKVSFLPGNPSQGQVTALGKNRPAYRNRICVLFRDFPVEDFGDRIPAITARISEASAAAPSQAVRFSSLTTTASEINSEPAIDWDAGLLYGYSFDLFSLRTLRLWDRREIKVQRITGGRRRYTSLSENGWKYHKETRRILAFADHGLEGDGTPAGILYPQLVVIDPATGKIVADSPRYVHGAAGGYDISSLAIVADPTMPGTFLVAGVERLGGAFFLARYDPATPAVYGLYDRRLIEGLALLTAGVPRPQTGGIYNYTEQRAIGQSGGSVRLYGAAGASLYEIEISGGDSPIITTTHLGTMGAGIRRMFYEPVRDRIYLFLADATAVEFYPGTGGGAGAGIARTDSTPFVWTNVGDYDPESARAGVVGVIHTTEKKAYLYDLDTGETETRTSISGIPANGRQVYDSASETFYMTDTFSTTAPAVAVPLGGLEAGKPVALSTVLRELARLAGYADSDILIENIPDMVNGAFFRDADTYQETLQQLSRAFSFDIVESGSKIKFRRPPTDAAFKVDGSIPSGRLVAQDGREISAGRTPDTDLPRQVELQYVDPAIGYDYSKQYARRPSAPIAVSQSTITEVIRLPVVLNASQAATLAAQRLYRLWEGQISQAFTTGPEFSFLEPGDVVEVRTDDFIWTAHVQRVQFGDESFEQVFFAKNYLTQVEAPIVGDSGQQPLIGMAPGSYASQYIHLDLPLLDGKHDLGGAGLRQYHMTAPRVGGDDWSGGYSWVAVGNKWTPIDQQTSEPTVGTCSTALSAPQSPWRVDETSTVTLSLLSGETVDLKSITEDELLNGRNLAAIGQPGRWEIVAFQTVEDLGGGNIRLSRFLRGLRGSEGMAGLHSAGDYFVLLDAHLGTVNYPVEELLSKLRFTATGLVESVGNAPVEYHTITGMAERPWAPVHLNAERIANGDLRLSWERRTRFGGEWKDGTEAVPLNEAAELYDVEIMDAAGAVKRTYANVATSSVVYPAADLLADFGGVQPASFSFRVYQLSAVVGRGFFSQQPIALA